MPDPVWYRSLYWRFAFGFVALLATLLVVQGAVFLWMTGSMAELFPMRSPAQLATSVARELGVSLQEDPTTDLNQFVVDKYPYASHAFVIVLRDCRSSVSQRVQPSLAMLAIARRRLGITCPDDRLPPGATGWGPPPPWGGRGGEGRGGDNRNDARGGGRGGGADQGRSGDFGRGRGFRGDQRMPPPSPLEYATVTVGGDDVGLVAVSQEALPLSIVLRDLGPTLATVALGLLVVGTAIAALVAFRPAHRRLRDLQQAAVAIGAGESGVRAQESGGDEVTSLARAFNEMAGRLEERTSALGNADRTRRQLLADVSHELSTPLAAIKGYVETLGMKNLAIDEPTRTRYLQIITEETERLEHIVGDLLDLAKLEGGGGAFKMATVSVPQLVERIRRRHAPTLEQKGVTLVTTVADDVGTVPGDHNRLEQALQNLVANAVRHTPEGGTITVDARRTDAGVRLTVEDTGPGIPPEHLPRVFDRFYKVDVSRTGTALPSGSGLGLSIVKAIVARHGGTVMASNRDEGGARFEILLPDSQA